MANDPVCPMWMMSFGDCMSLLVTFFVMLIAFTNMEEDKLTEALSAMKGALGVVDRPVIVSEAIEYDSVSRIKGQANRARWLTVSQLSSVLPDAELAVERFGRAQIGGAKKMVYVAMLEEGLAFIVHTESVFLEGTTEFKGKDYDELWQQISGFVSHMDNEVRVVCASSADAVLKTDKIKSIEGLCIARASAVDEELRSRGGLQEHRVSIAGKVIKLSDDQMPSDRLEIIIMGKRITRGMTPEEIIVRDKWK